MSYVIPPGSHRIPLEEAENMIDRYLENMDKVINPELMVTDVLPISETFRKEAILEYLSKPEVAYFRIYMGMSVDMKIHSIIVGVDKDGKDIVPDSKLGHGHGHPPGDGPDDGGLIFEDGVRCPTYCPPPTGPFCKPRHHHK